MTTATRTPYTPEELLEHFERAKPQGPNRWRVLCPVHVDTDPSLDVNYKDGKYLFACRSHGCSFKDIAAAAGLETERCFPDTGKGRDNGHYKTKPKATADEYPPPWEWKDRGLLEAVFPYQNEEGVTQFEVLRGKPWKGFKKQHRQRRADGKWTTDGTRPLPFMLPELLEDVAMGRTIFVVEGEKKVLALRQWGFAATCCAGGAKKWKPEHAEYLTGANVVIFPDNDRPGREHAEAVAKSLSGKASSIHVVALPGLPEKGDIIDWQAAGHTREELQALVAAAPEWIPVETATTRSERPTLANYRIEPTMDESGKPRKVAVPLPEITRALLDVADGWPKRINDRLFVDTGGAIRHLSTPDSLFAWIGEGHTVAWPGGTDADGNTLTPKAEFFESLRASVDAFQSVEEFPHEPEIAGSYYAWKILTNYKADGEALNGLLAFFDNAETPADRVLIRAMFLTPAWGGLAGLRPAFIITAPDRGYGKTTLADAVGSLYGGAIDLEADEARDERLKSRLLGDAALSKRVLRVDNVKTSQSSTQLEALITSSVISGHRLYAGETARPNYLTTIVTGNTVRLSRDLADRAFVIRLAKPKARPGWSENLGAYLESRRDHILADIVAELRKPVAATEARDRWQSWTSNVLARCTPGAAAIVAANQARRNECDDDLEEASLILDALRSRGLSFLTAAVATTVVNEALHVQWTTNKVTRRIQSHVEAGRLSGIERYNTGNTRGWNVA
ncbi:MAG: hypothetical protein HZB26_10900 [Candidatus Hydrogenedentes bacterium]|nr:hypothetical protein [Candidatus Hydrogenedentota bacterium]